MEKSQQLRPIKENWVDAVKILACILVVLGHFFQSMVKSDIIPETHLYSWFNQTIYYFHVPLFFICSGYLFQKFTSIGNFGEWKDNFLKKFVSLAIPYFVFSLATYLMKTVFSDSVNKERGGLIDTLFLNPTSPYWYLYALIFIFLITITIKRNTDAVAFIVAALAMKVASFFVDSNIYALNTVLENEIWFVFGMLICYCNIPSVIEKIKSYWGLLTSVIFIAVSIIIYRYTEWNEAVAFAMGVFGCVSVLLVALTMRQQGGVSGILSKYTFPVFLMHTIFAAGLRTVLFKLEISNSVIHIILGLTISFIGPVIVAAILAKLKYTEFLIYPNKFVRIGMKKNEKKLNGTVIVTYRCNAKCTMCNRYKVPSKPEDEITIETIRKLPEMYFTNITGGEPFIREDLKDIVRELYKKSDRIVISTNGFFTDRIVDLCKDFPDIGIRISIEGLEQTNNEIRGLDDGFNRGYTTLKTLVEMGMKDVGFGMTVQDKNAPDLVSLYNISDELGMEFATASLHNSFYFVESNNIIHDRLMVAQHFEDLINRLLESKSPKKWFRAYFNHGLINYIFSQKRLLPCDMSFDTFFIDPYGDVMPCNGTKQKEVMGNLNVQTWDELWNSPEAEKVRQKVRCCDRNCWMIGSVSPAMHKYIWKPAFWVVKHKFLRFWKKKKYSMFENKIVRDLRDGKVSKEELDRCSTCEECQQ